MFAIFVAITVMCYVCKTHCVAPSNDQNGERLCFNTNENQMAWPITDPNNVMHGLDHGVHCTQLVQDFSTQPPTDSAQRMHFEHCWKTVLEMHKSLEQEAGIYMISPTMCQHLFAAGKRDKRLIRLFKYPFKYGSYNICSLYAGGCKRKRSVDAVSRPSLETLSAESRYRKIAENSTGQMELFYMIGGTNFGDILWKGFSNPDSFTTPEHNFYGSLLSPHVTRLGALGVVCDNRASVQKAKEILADLIGSTTFTVA